MATFFDVSEIGLTSIIGLLLALTGFLLWSVGSKGKSLRNDKSSPIVPHKKRNETGVYTNAEVALHNTRDDVWIIVDGKVYDVTEYVDAHPGGDSILVNAGKDSTEGVRGPQHPVSMWDVLEVYRIGVLAPDDQ